MKHLLTIFALLLALTCCTTKADRNRMRAGLDSINVRNCNGQPFTVSDVQPYVVFFDEHGTPNDRLLAHYLLGLAYYDHGEAPMALQCYQDAAECADTTAKDCDYMQLCRVYAQVAQIFYEQGLYREQLVFQRLSSKYAWKGKDTLAALMSYEQESQAYRNLNLSDSLLYICEHVSQFYRQYGYPHYAARALANSLSTLISRQEFDKAKKYIQLYESESKFFDSIGNIQKGREVYYRLKGLYFLHTNILDSAEYYFRKELHNGKGFKNQHSASLGLAELYQRLHQPDSVAKYSQYAYAMSDSLYKKRTAKDVERIQAMYNYTRHQEVARRESEKAASANKKLLICFIVLLAVLLLATWLYIARKKLIENLQVTALELSQIRMENDDLRHNAKANQQQIAENAVRIKQLEKKLGRYGKLVYFSVEKTENTLTSSPNYLLIKEKAIKGQPLTDDDWTIVRNLADEYLPGISWIMKNAHWLNYVVENKEILVDNGQEKRIKTQHTTYANRPINGTPCYLPVSYSKSLGSNALETRATYSYDGKGNVCSITVDGIETVYIWSYNGLYPIAKIEGLTYDEVKDAVGSSKISALLNKAVPSTSDISSLRNAVNKKKCHITTYKYKPLVGIETVTLPNDMETIYKYDGFGRLTEVIDHNGSVISTNSYNYKK